MGVAEIFLTSEVASTSQPCDWFNAKQAEWQKAVHCWMKRLKSWKTLDRDRGGWAEPPPFSQFYFEDWVLLSIRYELHFLMHADRKIYYDFMPIEHTPFHYLHHFQNEFTIEKYGFHQVCMLAAVIQDTVAIERKSLLPVHPGDTNLARFVQIAGPSTRPLSAHQRW